GEACLTESGFIADQDRETIAKSSTLPHDSAPRVTSPAADEGKEEIVRLKERVQVLEDREEEIARVLTSMDAATVLAGGIDVPTDSGSIPTAGPHATVISTGSEVGPTASLIATRRKGKEVMVESDTLKKKRLQEQIDAQVARELEEQQEKEDMRMNEQIARDPGPIGLIWVKRICSRVNGTHCYLGHETTLPHAFIVRTLHDPTMGAKNMDTGVSSHLNASVTNLNEIFNTCIVSRAFY
nr:ribonuclease H-like domain-containing protein [Tanacetum cinerariifolium]